MPCQRANLDAQKNFQPKSDNIRTSSGANHLMSYSSMNCSIHLLRIVGTQGNQKPSFTDSLVFCLVSVSIHQKNVAKKGNENLLIELGRKAQNRWNHQTWLSLYVNKNKAKSKCLDYSNLIKSTPKSQQRSIFNDHDSLNKLFHH